MWDVALAMQHTEANDVLAVTSPLNYNPLVISDGFKFLSV